MTGQPAASLTNSASAGHIGRTEPRIWTPPLCELTPASSYGFDVIDFAEAIGWPLDPWERWAVVHFGELLPDGTPRFRFVLILVARQNGKTTLCRVLTLYWMFVECHKLIIGTSTSRDTAKASWREVINMAQGAELLKEELPALCTRETIGEEAFFNVHGSTYRFAAPNRRAGRSFTVNRALLDELREHQSWDVYDALVNAMNAVSDAQAVAITNQGDASSIVLDSIRESALGFIETGAGDSRLFLAEWSAPAGADPTDLDALAMANPNLGRRIPIDALMGQAIQARQTGGERLARFRTEVLCQRVTLLDPAIEPELWQQCGTGQAVNLAEHRRRVAIGFDVALDGSHATAVAAASIEGVTHVEVLKRWQGFGCTAALRRELPELVERIRPRVVAWLPSGPAAAVAADLKARRGGRRPWPPRGVKVEELTAEVTAVCMGLADVVHAGQLHHPDDPMLNAHISQTQKLARGDAWVFQRRGTEPIDGSYAAAVAVHAARTMPAPLSPLVVAG